MLINFVVAIVVSKVTQARSRRRKGDCRKHPDSQGIRRSFRSLGTIFPVSVRTDSMRNDRIPAKAGILYFKPFIIEGATAGRQGRLEQAGVSLRKQEFHLAVRASERDKKAKERFKYCLAVAAPALVPLVIIISTDALTMRRLAPLDRWGYLALAVIGITLAYLLWKGRWWAGLPSMAVFALAAVIFAVKAIRPLWAYYQANSFQTERAEG